MKRRVLFVCLLIMVLSFRVSAEPIKRVNFAVPYDSLQYALGTPIVAIESGIVEGMGWNRYGGWKIGIRSSDNRRYHYCAHCPKDHPFPMVWR